MNARSIRLYIASYWEIVQLLVKNMSVLAVFTLASLPPVFFYCSPIIAMVFFDETVSLEVWHLVALVMVSSIFLFVLVMSSFRFMNRLNIAAIYRLLYLLGSDRGAATWKEAFAKVPTLWVYTLETASGPKALMIGRQFTLHIMALEKPEVHLGLLQQRAEELEERMKPVLGVYDTSKKYLFLLNVVATSLLCFGILIFDAPFFAAALFFMLYFIALVTFYNAINLTYATAVYARAMGIQMSNMPPGLAKLLANN
jgi:hypothetical protein